MTRFMLLAAFIAVFVASSEANEPNSDVIVLTDDNFETQFNNSKNDWFVEIYAPWCGHCKALAPIWEEIATELKGKVNIANLDGTMNDASSSRFGVKGYPTLIHVSTHKGELVTAEYNGGRNRDALLAYATGGHSTAAPIESRPKLPPAPEKIPERDPSIPSDVHELTNDNFDELLTSHEGAWMIEVYSPYCGFCKKLAPIWEDVATSLKGKVHFGKVDGTKHSSVKSRFAGEASGFPSVFYVVDNKFYKFGMARNKAALTAFATGGWQFKKVPQKKKKTEKKDTTKDDVSDNETKEKVKPEEAKKIPVEGRSLLPTPIKRNPKDPSHVHVLNDRNFDETVRQGIENGEDWFIMFYEPWCTHCNAMKPTWEDLAAQFKGKKLNFGYVDCGKAKWAKWHWKIDAYPNLRFISAKTQLQYQHEEDRDHFSLIGFATGGYLKKGVKGNSIPWDKQKQKQEMQVEEEQSPVVSILSLGVVVLGFGAVAWFLIRSKSAQGKGKNKPDKKKKGKKAH